MNQAAPDTESAAGHRASALVLALILALGFAWGVARLAGLRMAPSEWQPATWVDGHAGKLVNAALGTLPGQASVDRWAAALRYRVLGDLGTQVLEGCPGWLFYRDGLRVPAGHAEALAQRVQLMRHWSERLRRSGVQLLVATVPDKSRTQARQLCGLQVAPAALARWDRWYAALQSAGVAHVDVRAQLASLPQAFFRTDVHMAPAGAQRFVDSVAPALLAWLGGPGAQQFATTTGQSAEPRMGDLIVLAGLGQAPEGWRPPLERIIPEHIEAQRSGGLLDDTAPVEVLLAGDSNGLRSGLAERLGRSLGREVWNLSQDGGYFSGAMLAALEREDRWRGHLKVVVWVFSELSLSMPVSADEQRAWAAAQ